MALLTPPQIQSVTDATVEGGLADPAQRQRLLDGINERFKAFHLRTVDQPGGQILSDLATMNQVEQLADGSVPLQIWLQNAIYLTRDLARPAKTFNAILTVLNGKVTGQPAIAKPAELPETKEHVIHRDDRLPFGFLAKGAAVGTSVARLTVPTYANGVARKRVSGAPKRFVGTGWLLTNTLLVTNHHVINAREDHEGDASDADFALQARSTSVEFDYDADDAERAAFGVAELLLADRELDFAILRLNGDSGRPALPIRRSAVTKKQDDYIALNIVQHPTGGPKMVAIRNNLLTHADATTLRYFTDTSGGASGSPVLTDDWHVVALHRASAPVDNVSFQGRATAWVNVGTQIAAILDQIAAKDERLAAEIQRSGRIIA
jgi:endonuclease G